MFEFLVWTHLIGKLEKNIRVHVFSVYKIALKCLDKIANYPEPLLVSMTT